MKIFIRLVILIIPIVGFVFFYNLLTEDKFYPGANFDRFNVPVFALDDITSQKIYTKDDLKSKRG